MSNIRKIILEHFKTSVEENIPGVQCLYVDTDAVPATIKVAFKPDHLVWVKENKAVSPSGDTVKLKQNKRGNWRYSINGEKYPIEYFVRSACLEAVKEHLRHNHEND